jgi:hypothetical protein
MRAMAKGKWAQGIVPRNFCWIIKDQLAVCERPGGYGVNHRRVRRQEEIIWIRENEFTSVISLIPSPHNLHNYDELEVSWLHRPISDDDEMAVYLAKFYPELYNLLGQGDRLLVHREELGDLISGIMAGYLLWSGLIPTGPKTISITERILERQLGPQARGLVELAGRLPPPGRLAPSVPAPTESDAGTTGAGNPESP